MESHSLTDRNTSASYLVHIYLEFIKSIITKDGTCLVYNYNKGQGLLMSKAHFVPYKTTQNRANSL